MYEYFSAVLISFRVAFACAVESLLTRFFEANVMKVQQSILHVM
jgi:hypothetical protein